MNLAITLLKYYPFGEIQNNCLCIAAEAAARNHIVTIYTTSWTGEIPEYVSVQKVPLRGYTYHRQCRNFFADLQKLKLSEKYDLILGMERGPGLDVYFSSKKCFASGQAQNGDHSLLSTLSGRKRTFCELEQAVFSPESKTQILYVVEWQKQQFVSFYGTPYSRFHLLPPGMNPQCLLGPDSENRRSKMRFALSLGAKDIMLICKGSDLKAKGADRILQAISALHPAIRNLIKVYFIGPMDPNLELMAKRAGLSRQVYFPGPCVSNAADYLLAADLLVYPARDDAAGTVIVEAICSGVPVLCTENCGFYTTVKESDAGCVIPADFNQSEFNAVLESMLFEPERIAYFRKAAIAYSQQNKVNHCAEKAVDLLEQFYEQKNAHN